MYLNSDLFSNFEREIVTLPTQPSPLDLIEAAAPSGEGHTFCSEVSLGSTSQLEDFHPIALALFCQPRRVSLSEICASSWLSTASFPPQQGRQAFGCGQSLCHDSAAG